MANYYADSSVLVKRHVPESGSVWVKALSAPAMGNVIVTAHLSLIELYSALNRRLRENSINTPDYKNIAADLSVIFSSQYGIIPLIPIVVNDAKGLLERHPLRAYDAIQLASALYARIHLQATGHAGLIFLSADIRLLTAAQAEGFTTDDPNLH